MTSLTLLRKPHSQGRLNLRGLVPDRLLPLSCAEIEKLALDYSADSPGTVADQFTLRDGDRDRLVIEGELSDCDYVAGGMLSGELLIESDVGNYLASGMRDGRVVVSGNAGSYAAGDLRGGLVSVRGNVGCHAAAATPFAVRGMSGGELVIGGSADQFLGSRMRRGRVIVLGEVAAGCASRMIAGTIVLCGPVVLPLGYGMARGTLMLLHPSDLIAERGVVGFTELESCELSFLALLLQDIATRLPAEQAAELTSGKWLRGLGDRGVQGQGELFIRQLSSPSPGEPWIGEESRASGV